MLTGGGSAGHVTVNLALIPRLKQDGWTVEYIGSFDGIEKQLIDKVPDIPYHGISTGKLRRYFDWNNVKDPFKVVKGILQAYQIIRKRKPRIIFSKGGFVSVPVILGAWLNKVPVIIHESDITPGLANRISMPFASKVCVTFPETMKHVKRSKAEYVGAIIRDELLRGNVVRGLSYCNFIKGKPVLLIMGGSQGSRRLNEQIRTHLDQLTERFQIVHICGKGNVDPSLQSRNYRQFEYIHAELADFMAMSDVVVSRAGSNSIFEFLALQKPMLLIPLSRQASRGDQILNAESFRKSGYAEVLQEEEFTDDRLLKSIYKVYEDREAYVNRMKKNSPENAALKVMEMIRRTAK
jgi:UDP-N-acetylglucosamine--N-acetylmuramyl-(pentapeptide) pyrophosphoryl-undecaprenol N-acetylglucosamine transferase